MQSNAEADMGRNAGANQNMVLKSGTNNIHGNVFYFNRNEFFAAINPVAPVGSRKVQIRNNQVRPHSALGYLTPEEFATGYANVESNKRFPHSHSLDYGCELNLQLNSNPSALTCAD